MHSCTGTPEPCRLILTNYVVVSCKIPLPVINFTDSIQPTLDILTSSSLIHNAVTITTALTDSIQPTLDILTSSSLIREPVNTTTVLTDSIQASLTPFSGRLVPTVIYASSSYPLLEVEALSGSLVVTSGTLRELISPSYVENLSSNLTATAGGIVEYRFVTTTIAAENLTASLAATAGVIVEYRLLNTTVDIENLMASLTATSGVIVEYRLVTQTILPESLSGNLVVTSGTLN